MDLAVALGKSVAEVRQMSEREFVRWQYYAARKQLPSRRAEIQSAMLCSVISAAFGIKHQDGTTLGFDDFMLTDAKPKKKAVVPASVAAAALGPVRKLGQRRNRG